MPSLLKVPVLEITPEKVPLAPAVPTVNVELITRLPSPLIPLMLWLAPLQSKVAPDLQGRVFSARRLIAWLTNPISPLIGGVLVDFVLEPAARAGMGLPNAMAWLVGTGPGSGMGTLIVFCGLGGILAGIAGYFSKPIRNAETILPDHDALPKAAEPAYS